MLAVLALFSLAWMILLEARLPPLLYGVPMKGLYYDKIWYSALLAVACLCLLLRIRWSHVTAIVLSGFVLYDVLFGYFWRFADYAGVPRFSREHFSLWWPNLESESLFQIILSVAVLAASIMSSLQLRKAMNAYR